MVPQKAMLMIDMHRSFTLGALVAAVATIGCSEAVPPANQGAVSAQFRSSSLDPDGKQCNLGGHEMQIGFAHATQQNQITFQRDGDAGDNIFCSVKSEGGGFKVQVEMDVGANVLSIDANVSTSNSETDRATGSLGYRTVATINKLITPNDAPCTFWLNESQEIAAGRAWLTFECDRIENNDRSCGLQRSIVALQNCDQ